VTEDRLYHIGGAPIFTLPALSPVSQDITCERIRALLEDTAQYDFVADDPQRCQTIAVEFRLDQGANEITRFAVKLHAKAKCAVQGAEFFDSAGSFRLFEHGKNVRAPGPSFGVFERQPDVIRRGFVSVPERGRCQRVELYFRARVEHGLPTNGPRVKPVYGGACVEGFEGHAIADAYDSQIQRGLRRR